MGVVAPEGVDLTGEELQEKLLLPDRPISRQDLTKGGQRSPARIPQVPKIKKEDTDSRNNHEQERHEGSGAMSQNIGCLGCRNSRHKKKNAAQSINPPKRIPR